MATQEEIQESISNSIADGVAESQLSDRRESMFTPKERIDGLKALQEFQASQSSPFIRVGFTGRHC